jgi:predicted enzyme related to lactoylglutathione lyase
MKSQRIAFLLWLVLLPFHAADAATGDLPPVSTSGEWHPGKFVWADLITDDIDTAKRFYADLLGWEFRQANVPRRSYLIAFNGERPISGLLQAPQKQASKGRPRWISYLSVTEVGQALQSVVINGGKVLLAPKRLPERGEQAIVRDAEGAVFGVMKTSKGDPQDYLAEPGDWIWEQLLSLDAERAGGFYQTLADYTVIKDPKSRLPDTLILIAHGHARATVTTIPADRPSLQPTWLPFVRVADIRDAVARTDTLGGRVLLAPRADLLEGRLAVIADPSGAALGLIEWDYTQTGEEK